MKAIYTARGDGLGTRMLSAVYGRILAEMIDVPFRVIWNPLGGAEIYKDYTLMHPKYLTEIFAEYELFTGPNESLNGKIINSSDIENLNLQSIYYSRSEISSLNKFDLKSKLINIDGLLYDFPAPLIDFMSSETSINERCIDIWSKVNWSNAVRNAVDKINMHFDLSTCIAAHVRRGDIIDVVNRGDLEHLINGGMIQILQRYTPVSAFFEKIDLLEPSENILVCTEDQDIARHFYDRYGKHRVASSMELDLTENQRAATDLLLLSRAKKIVAPVLSFFSNCASTVSRAELINTSWHLESSIVEIASLIDQTDPGRVRQVSAIMNAAAYKLIIDQDLDLAARFRSQAVQFDEALFLRVLG